MGGTKKPRVGVDRAIAAGLLVVANLLMSAFDPLRILDAASAADLLSFPLLTVPINGPYNIHH